MLNKIFMFIGYHIWYSKLNKNGIFLDKKYFKNTKRSDYHK